MNPENNKEKDNEEIKIPEKLREIFWTIVGVVLIIIVVSIISKFVGWNSLSLEEQKKIEKQKQSFSADLKHCQSVLSSSNLDINNSEVQRCNSLMQEVVSDVNNSRP